MTYNKYIEDAAKVAHDRYFTLIEKRVISLPDFSKLSDSDKE